MAALPLIILPIHPDLRYSLWHLLAVAMEILAIHMACTVTIRITAHSPHIMALPCHITIRDLCSGIIHSGTINMDTIPTDVRFKTLTTRIPTTISTPIMAVHTTAALRVPRP